MTVRNRARRVAIYARVSTDAQTTDNQIRELRAAAERHDWQVVAEFVDRGISGAKGCKDRPALDKLLRGAVLHYITAGYFEGRTGDHVL